MSQFHVLQETPDGSGNWTATGEVLGEHSRDDALDRVAVLSASGGRFAIYEYNAMRIAPPEAATKVGDLVADGQEHMATIAGDHPAETAEHDAVPEAVPTSDAQPEHEPAPEPAQDAAEHPAA